MEEKQRVTSNCRCAVKKRGMEKRKRRRKPGSEVGTGKNSSFSVADFHRYLVLRFRIRFQYYSTLEVFEDVEIIGGLKVLIDPVDAARSFQALKSSQVCRGS